MDSGLQTNKPRILVHSCCGPCSTAVTERLAEHFSVTLFFYNPNITDENEYLRRLESQRRFVDRYNLMVSSEQSNRFGATSGTFPEPVQLCNNPKRHSYAHNLTVNAEPVQNGQSEQIRLIVGLYEPQIFLDRVAGLEDVPEGGARCEQCFALRLEKTAETALTDGTENFTTTLSVSPYKNYAVIARLGTEIARRNEIHYYAEDFKKKDGYRRSVALAKDYELYRQDYCGCVFSKNERGAHEIR